MNNPSTGGDRPGPTGSSAGPLLRGLHVFALVQVAAAYPLYALLGRYPEFFVARQAQPIDIWLLVLALSLALPLALAVLGAMAARIDPRLGRLTHLLLVTVLFLLLGLSIASKLLDGAATVATAAVFCLLATIAYWRSRVGSLFVTFLAPAIVVVPALFLLNEQIASLLAPTDAAATAAGPASPSDAPIIFIVFDELPTFALLNDAGEIDTSRFPNFARLADRSYWFANATTVATGTVLAIPPILTGRYPDRFAMPHHGEYPDNLFTWLGEGYDFNVREAVSVLCPKKLCGTARVPPAAARLRRLLLDSSAIFLNIVATDFLAGKVPIVTQSWEDFWGSAEPGGQMYEHRLQQLTDFTADIRPTAKPSLDFIHVNFPHIPYEYLPSGKRYGEGWLMPGLDFATDVWTGSPWQTEQAYERFLLQLGALDGWLGQLLEHLQATDLFERSVIVVTADHGVSFDPGASRRDTPPLENLAQSILPVPLIIKLPHQSAGVVSRSNAETVDIVPTLADVLDRPLTWRADGRSLLGEPGPTQKRAVHRYKEMDEYRTDTARIEAAVLRAARRAAEWVGRPGIAEGPAHAYGALLGTRISHHSITRDASMRSEVQDLEQFSDVRLAGGFLPAHINGLIRPAPAQSTPLAIAINGVIVALTQSYLDGDDWRFSVMVPEASFRDGENTLEILAVGTGASGHPALTALGPQAGASEDQWRLDGGRLTRNGLPLTIDPDGIQGHIDYISRSDEAVELFGWAIDAASRRTVRSILVFDGENMVYSGTTRMLREETHRFGVVIKLGFHAVVPGRRISAAGTRGLRIFAVTEDDRVKELQRE